MKNKLFLILMIGLCLPFFGSAQSSGGDFIITKSVIASGGGAVSDTAGNMFSMTGVNGQPAAGTRAANPPFSVSNGFFAFNLAPTAAFALIQGRVVSGESNGIKSALVSLAGGNLTTPRRVMTNDLGYFTFFDVEVGQFYVLSVRHKNYGFGQNTQSLTLIGDTTDLIFRADWEN